MKKVNKYETLYRKNNDTGRIIIDIALEDYLEFFMSGIILYSENEIYIELAEFLDLCSEDIPLRKKIEIVFTMNTDEISIEKEEQIRISYKNYYNSLQRLESRKTKRFFQISAILLFTSLVLLTAYALLREVTKESIISDVLLESLLIGGWVFTWEAVHLLFLDIIEPFRRRREIKRFLEAELTFKHWTR